MLLKNQNERWRHHLLTFLLTVHCSIAIAKDWGSIRGQILVEGVVPDRLLLIAKGADIQNKEICAAEDHYADDLIIDKQSKGLANVFVYLAKKPKSIHPDLIEVAEKPVPFEMVGCQFKPHALICRAGGRIEVKATDRIVHNHHMYALKNSQSGILIPPRGKELYSLRVAESLPFPVRCDFHPWMSGYWLIVDHPYAALTDKNGRFAIDNLPVGEHQFKIWHERVGYVERKHTVTVSAGDPVEWPVMKVDIARLQKSAEGKQR